MSHPELQFIPGCLPHLASMNIDLEAWSLLFVWVCKCATTTVSAHTLPIDVPTTLFWSMKLLKQCRPKTTWTQHACLARRFLLCSEDGELTSKRCYKNICEVDFLLEDFRIEKTGSCGFWRCSRCPLLLLYADNEKGESFWTFVRRYRWAM